MNERIKKLYEQSFVTDDYVNVGINGVELGIKFDPEKFAELIVRECAQVAKDIQTFYDENNDSQVNTEIWTMIKEHFGVEE